MKNIHTLSMTGLIVAGFLSGSDAIAQTANSTEPQAVKAEVDPIPFTDAAIPQHQRDLLVLAFDVASAIPVNPHIKDRCKLQEEVAAACLQLNQPRLALEFAQRIDDWRRGAALADLALYCAKNGFAGEVEGYLHQARSIAASADDWRRDLIRSKIARVHVWMGQEMQAAQFTTELGKPEMAIVESAIAERTTEAEFDARMTSLVVSLTSGDFDLMRGALDACVILYGRYYADAERRKRIEDSIRLHAEQMPVPIRLDLFLQMSKLAVDNGDTSHAKQLAEQARTYLYIYVWQAGDKVPYLGRVAAVQWLAGDVEKAESELNAAISLYVTERDDIITVARAKALLPVAEAYHTMGRTPAALSIYRRALEEANANRNARPRANDLGATCLSMGLSGVEPDEALWQTLRSTWAGLNDPW